MRPMKTTRREFLRFSAAAAGAGLLAAAAGCQVQYSGGAVPVASGEAAQPAAPRVKRGGVIRVVRATAVDSLDPQIGAWHEDNRHLLFDRLFGYRLIDPEAVTFETTPALAESFEVVDPLTYRLNLRQGVKFHDGSDFNAAVAKWNLDRAKQHPESKVKESITAVDEVEVVDAHTILLHLNAPAPLLPLLLSHANPVAVDMVSMEAVEKLGDEGFAQNPVGSGPMRLKEWIRDDRIVLERFEDHWEAGEDGQPLPYLDGYEGRLILDQSVALIEMRTGNMDVLSNVLLQDLATAQAEAHLVVSQKPGIWSGYPSLYFNPNPPDGTDYPFSKHKELRHAAQYATDRASLAKTLGFGVGVPHYYWGWYPGLPGYDESLPRREYDLDMAKKLLADAGFPDGVDVEVKVINRATDVQPLEVVQAMWAQAGIRMHINLLDRVPWVDDGRAGRFEALTHGNSPTIDALLRQETRTGSTYNWAGYSNPEVDALWEQANEEYDPQQRVGIYRKIQEIIIEDAYHFVGYRYPSMQVLNRRVQDWTISENIRYAWLD